MGAQSRLTRLVPGAYVDEAGTLHLDLPEMCEAAGFPATPENQARLQAAAVEMFGGAEFEEIADGGRGRWRQSNTGEGPEPGRSRPGVR